MTASLFIDGAVGTTGLEIRERLSGRSEFSLILLDDAERKDAARRAQALNDADYVILCLPDEAAVEAVSLITSTTTRVIDASSAHRVADGWVYGFAELEPTQQAAIAGAARVANPGCWPTAYLALVRPLVRAGIIPAQWMLSAGGASGYSGGGRAMIEEFESGRAATGYRAYGLNLAHKHLPEMQKHSRMEHPPVFQPAVAASYRGMLLEVPLPLTMLPRVPAVATIENILKEAYQNAPLIDVVDADASQVTIEEHAGTDRMTIRVFGNDRGQARLVATLDNLGKGAAGAAVQNLNIMAGCDPLAGLAG